MNDAASTLKVGICQDFQDSNGQSSFDELAWRQLDAMPGVSIEFLRSPGGSAIERSDICDYDVLIVKRNTVEASLFSSSAPGELRLKLLARNGVGLDRVDVGACTAAGVVVATTPDGVARPVASSIMAMMLAFSHNLVARDRLARAGSWAHRWNATSPGLAERTLGVVGLGNIGLELFRLAKPWGMRHLGATRTVVPQRYSALGIETTSLSRLLTESDFVALCCPLTPDTMRLIDAAALSKMKNSAYLINCARGEIVDEAALVQALTSREIAGAGIDVYEVEPPSPSNPLFSLDNVLLGSHNLAFTDELNSLTNRSAVSAIRSFAEGYAPLYTVNREVLRHPRAAGLRIINESSERT